MWRGTVLNSVSRRFFVVTLKGHRVGGWSCLRAPFRLRAGLTDVYNLVIWRNDHGGPQRPRNAVRGWQI
jgi:hypothetical protein